MITNLELDAAEKAALTVLLKDAIERDRFPVLPRIKALRRMLDKLEPPGPRPEEMPAAEAAERAEHRADEDTPPIAEPVFGANVTNNFADF
jgi:hypothetical protein